jgi:hypothetical protein
MEPLQVQHARVRILVKRCEIDMRETVDLTFSALGWRGTGCRVSSRWLDDQEYLSVLTSPRTFEVVVEPVAVAENLGFRIATYVVLQQKQLEKPYPSRKSSVYKNKVEIR